MPKIVGIPERLPKRLNHTPSVMRQADAYGFYMLVLFKPWDLVTHIPSGELNFAGFQEFIREKKQSNTLEDRSMLQIIHTITYGLTPNSKSKVMMTKFRTRDV